MKVLLVNGSPHKDGCTATALKEVEKTLNENGIETELFHIGVKPISGCLACRSCTKTGKCVIDDVVNEFTRLAQEVDGFVFGSPVYFAGISGAMKAFMDRAFYSGGQKAYRLKPAACVVSARRAGTTASLDQMNKYLLYYEMPIVSSQYWNMVHGNTPQEVLQDAEGLQIMRTLGRNMAWLLKCKEAGEKAGIEMPQTEERVRTNFVR